MAFRYSLSKFIPFRDEKACARVRAIRRQDITKHPNKAFRIEVIDDRIQFYSRFAIDIVERIRTAAEAGKKCVLILPVGPVPQYAIAAEMIASDAGLGRLTWEGYVSHTGTTVLIGMISIGLAGYLSTLIVTYAEKRMMPWQR